MRVTFFLLILIFSPFSMAAPEFINKGTTLPSNLPFSEAVRHGDTLYLSGQLGNKPGTLEMPDGFEAQAVQVMTNIQSILSAVVYVLGMDIWDPSVRQLTTIPAEIRFVEVAATVALSLTLSFLVTLIPAWQAARLDPVEALRYE